MRCSALASMLAATICGVLVIVLGSPLAPAAAEPVRWQDFSSEQFQKLWYDGNAELAGYELTIPRYGQVRKGEAVTIFVTEPFSNSARVKADPGKHPASDEFPVMKLNLVEDFPTGVYDYNLMTCVFVALSSVNNLPPGTPTKVSFSSQEWCGHVYEQLLFDSSSIRRTRHSYFDGEADVNDTLELPKDGLSEDALLLWARGMAGPALEPGQSIEVPLLTGVKVTRLNHVPANWAAAKLSRSRETQKLKVPAGDFEVDVFTVAVDNDAKRSRSIYVERAFPHRIIKWEAGNGEKAELLGVERMTYWKMNGGGFEEAVKKLGLNPRPQRTM